MATEIERRFLVLEMDRDILGTVPAHSVWDIEQGYLNDFSDSQHLRVRIIDRNRATLTRKRGTGVSREENEIDLNDLKAAYFILRNCKYRLHKSRYLIDGCELDRYYGVLNSITIAEKELNDPSEKITLPEWIYKAVEVTDSITNLHLARLAAELEYGWGEKNLLTLDELLRRSKKTHSVVLTGGPLSGKSTMIDDLKNAYKLNPVINFVPEVATIIISRLGVRPQTDIMRFQTAVYQVQKIFELTSIENAVDEHKQAVLLDRGTVDSAAYLAGGTDQMCKLFDTSLKREYSRYDLVLCLEVAPPEIFEMNQRSNPARSETYEQALRLQSSIIDAWNKHPNFHLVTNNQQWEEKVAQVKNIIDAFLNKNPLLLP